MRSCSLLRAGVCLGFLATMLVVPEAHGFNYRRPNLVGPYTQRRMTNPVNAMTLILGPGSSFTFGQRYDERAIEGGLELGYYGERGSAAPDPITEAWTRFGIGFGLLPYLDAGAVFLNFQWGPSFNFTEVLVYMTQAFNLGDWELGVRFSFLSPSRDNGWQFNPGLLSVYRGDRIKFESGVFFSAGTSGLFLDAKGPNAHYAGLNVPLRLSYNLTPHVYLGGSSGLAVPHFEPANRTTVPLGVLFGYTFLAKNQLFDLSTSMTWDQFVLLAPDSGVAVMQPGIFRFNVGITMHRMATPPPR